MGWVCGMGSSGKEKRPPGSYGHQTEHPERVASGSEVYRGEGGAAVSATGGGATMHSAHSRRAGGGGIYICPGAAQGFCLTVGHDPKQPESVKNGKITRDAGQKWTLVDGDRFRNVGNGEFLDSDLSYAFVHHLSEIWDSNHSDLRTAPRTETGSQKWVLGPEEFHGGKVLRHWMDGRGVDVHGWAVEKDGGNMGVENSVHGECKGISYVLRLSDDVDKDFLP